MTAKVLTILTAIALALAGATATSAAPKGKAPGCKGEFMYTKDGKCMDARDKVDKKS
jgi:hypothetical protein